MTDILNLFDELLESLTFAQVSIEKTSRFVLKNLDHIESILLLWKKHTLKADEKKLIPLLYLANDVIQRIKPHDDACKNKFAQCLLENINLFKHESVTPTFLRVVKIWAERNVLSQDFVAKFKNQLEQISVAVKPVKYHETEYDVTKLIGFLNIFNEMNNIITAYKSSATKKTLGHYTREISRCKFSHDCDYISQMFQEIKAQRQKCIAPFQEIKEAIINCQLQTTHIASYTSHYNKLLTNTQKILEEYSEYRNRIIQLRWRVEKIHQKFEERLKQTTPKPTSSLANNEVSDMEVDNDQINDAPNSNSFNQLLNQLPPYSIADKPLDPYYQLLDQYSHYIYESDNPPGCQPYNCLQTPMPVRQYGEESHPSPTIVDYHHGMLDNQMPSSMYAPIGLMPTQYDVNMEQINPNNYPFPPIQIPPPFFVPQQQELPFPPPNQYFPENVMYDNFGNPYNFPSY